MDPREELELKNLTQEEKLREAVRIRQELLRRKWIASLYYFNTQCLGVEAGKDKVKLNAFHRELCDFVDLDKHAQKLILVPRGHLKSTLVTVGKTLQWIAENPKVRILIANATYSMAVAFLTVIKRHLQNNEMMQMMFGNLAINPEKWSENSITLDQTGVEGGEKEATVFCYGMGGNLVSQHYDKIILDDVVNDVTVGTREQIEKTIQFYRMCQPLLEKDGEMIIIGTRYRDDDLYSWIMDRENGVVQDFKIFGRRAMKGEIWDQGKQEFVKGEILWPEKYTLKDLSTVRRKMGPYEFSSQYFNECIPKGDADFKREWFQYYETADIKGLDMNKYILIDPAISLEKDADFTAMIVIGVDEHSNIYILDIFREKVKVDGIIKAIFQLNERWHPQAIGLEEVAFQTALRYSLKKEMEERKRYLNIVELKPHGRNKETRIRALQPLYSGGKVLHNRDLIYNIYLEDELLRFPYGKHDDTIDALAYALDLIHPAVKKVTAQRHSKNYLYG
ncbi:MAG: phage terminase large subunit [Janthinobacterium sp.]|jgi:predicted phage terminase large subunit-like protein